MHADAVASAYFALSPPERETCILLTRNYGEAGALNYYGRALGLPEAASQHNSFYLWGPGNWNARSVLAVGFDLDELRRTFEFVDEVTRARSEYAMPYEADLPVYFCRGWKIPLREAWIQGRMYI